MLKGYVTYIGAAGLLLVAAYQWFTGDPTGTSRSLAEAVSISGLRRAIG